MVPVLGQSIPYAIGVGLSPLPITAVILLLFSSQPQRKSFGFLIGWALGILVPVLVFATLTDLIPDDGDIDAAPLTAVLKIVVGSGMVLFAIAQWLWSRWQGNAGQVPKWLQLLDSFGPFRAFGLAAVMAAFNFKNLLLFAHAGLLMSTSDGLIEMIVLAVSFTVIAALTIALPVVIYAIDSKRVAGPLATLRDWLVRHNATIMAIVLLVLGIAAAVEGIIHVSQA